jgi:AcrR family transcriptional regulator
MEISMSHKGRPRGFDKEAALLAAMRVFWAKGFDGASMTDLTAAMGIGSPSLYAAFGSKEELLRQAFVLYRESEVARILKALETDSPVVDTIGDFLESSARSYVRPGLQSGCMMVFGAHNAISSEEDIHRDLRAARSQMIGALRSRLERAVAAGELPTTFNSASAAGFIGTLQIGMSTMARDGADLDTLLAVAKSGAAGFSALARAHVA